MLIKRIIFTLICAIIFVVWKLRIIIFQPENFWFCLLILFKGTAIRWVNCDLLLMGVSLILILFLFLTQLLSSILIINRANTCRMFEWLLLVDLNFNYTTWWSWGQLLWKMICATVNCNLAIIAIVLLSRRIFLLLVLIISVNFIVSPISDLTLLKSIDILTHWQSIVRIS